MLAMMKSKPRTSILVLLLPHFFSFGPSPTSVGADVPTAAMMGVDWLVRRDAGFPSEVRENVCWDDGLCGLEMTNGLLSRRFATSPAFGTVDMVLHQPFNRSMFRAVEPEATVVLRIDVDTEDEREAEFRVGGLTSTDGFRAYCNRTSLRESLRAAPSEEDATTFRYVSHSVGRPSAPFPWTPGTRHGLQDASWPPRGVTLNVVFELTDGFLGAGSTGRKGSTSSSPSSPSPLTVALHYELYDGIPLMSKWMTISSSSSSEGGGSDGDASPPPTVVRSATVERLASVPPFGAYITHGSRWPLDGVGGAASRGTGAPPPLLHAATDQAHGAKCQWVDDFATSNSSDFPGASPTTPDHDEGAAEPLLICNYTVGPGAVVTAHDASKEGVEASASFMSFRSLLLATDSPEIERQSLMRHRVTQTLAPHTTENPIFFHATAVEDDGDFRHAVDQLAEVGFEMLMYSFGAGFRLEDADEAYLARITEQVEYANSRGIEVGGYDLICLERGFGGYGAYVGDEYSSVGGDGDLLKDACFASGWYDKLLGLVKDFVDRTGISTIETDGPYGGGTCSSRDHSHHHGEEDSIYQQTQMQNAFYKEMRKLGVYVNQPDEYFFQGGSRTGMGYSESQYSLPRWRDLTISRMGLYDDLYRLLPTQGWMFVPLVEYHGGGEAATFLGHNEEYEWALAQYLGAGTAACYRGPYLYDNTTADGLEMKAKIKKWVEFYKMYRDTLIQPVVHLQRPTMQSWDGWMHVNPFGKSDVVAVAMIFNPTDAHLRGTSLALPLYYTSLAEHASIAINDEAPFIATLARDFSITLSVDMKPRSIHTVVVRKTEGDDGDSTQETSYERSMHVSQVLQGHGETDLL